MFENVSLTSVLFVHIFCRFCLNFDYFLLKYGKTDIDSPIGFKFENKTELVNCLNQLFWLDFQLNFFSETSALFPFFIINGVKYAYLAHFVQFYRRRRHKKFGNNLWSLKYGPIVT